MASTRFFAHGLKLDQSGLRPWSIMHEGVQKNLHLFNFKTMVLDPKYVKNDGFCIYDNTIPGF